MELTKEHKDYAELYNGRVYWARIELKKQPDGVLFISPVDKVARLVEGVTLKDIQEDWHQGDYLDDILTGIADAGAGRWIMGHSTDYDFIDEKGKCYLEVTEVIRGDIEEFIKERETEEQDLRQENSNG